LREVSSGLADAPQAIDGDDLIEHLLRRARLDLDRDRTGDTGAAVRTPEETDALRRALETLVKALTGPSVERYRYASVSHPGVEYEITVDGADVACTCPGFEYRGQCRHARDMKAAIAAGKPAPVRYRGA
jgi:hypothetical protein